MKTFTALLLATAGLAFAQLSLAEESPLMSNRLRDHNYQAIEQQQQQQSAAQQTAHDDVKSKAEAGDKHC